MRVLNWVLHAHRGPGPSPGPNPDPNPSLTPTLALTLTLTPTRTPTPTLTLGAARAQATVLSAPMFPGYHPQVLHAHKLQYSHALVIAMDTELHDDLKRR